MKTRILLVLLFMLVWSVGCKKDEVPDPDPEPTAPNLFQTKSIIGLVEFPAGSSVNYGNLKVITLTATAEVNPDGTFQLDAPSGYYSHIFVVDEMTQATVAAIYDSTYNNIRIDNLTTAKAILMMFPLDWGKICFDPADVLSKMVTSPHWNEYLTMVENLMTADPMHLLDYNTHPRLLETAAEVINDLTSDKLKSYEDEQYNGAYLIDDAGENIKVKNPKATPYGISVYDMQGSATDQASYKLAKTPLYVNGWDFDYWVLPNEGEATYNLGYGDFVCILSKPDVMYLTSLGISPALGPVVLGVLRQQELSKAISDGDYIKALQADALTKSYIGAQLTLLIRALNVISVLDPSEFTGVAATTLKHGPEVLDLAQRILLGGEDWVQVGTQFTIKNLLKCLMSSLTLSYEQVWIVVKAWALEDGYIINISADYLKVELENLSVVLDVLDAIENGALLLGFGYDMLTADQNVVYKIHKDGIQNQFIQTYPPENPVVSGVPPSVPFGSELNITLRSQDPEGELIQYWLYKNPYSLVKSEWVPSGSSYMFSFTPSTMGEYNMVAYALDKDGAMSGPVTITCTVTSGQAFFFDGFESWSTGRFENNEIWTVDYYLPSEVRIVNEASDGSQAVKLIDYDPAIGDAYGYYAGLYTYVEGNPNQVQFAIRIEEPQDEFGVRTWQTLGDFGTLAYYIAVMSGQLHWVQFAMDAGDPEDFIPFMPVNAQQWYQVKLLIDWFNGTYDIYVDNQLKVNDARFVQDMWSGHHVGSAPYFQAVAFIETQCRSAYLDEVYMEGAVLSSPSRKAIPQDQFTRSVMRNNTE